MSEPFFVRIACRPISCRVSSIRSVAPPELVRDRSWFPTASAVGHVLSSLRDFSENAKVRGEDTRIGFPARVPERRPLTISQKKSRRGQREQQRTAEAVGNDASCYKKPRRWRQSGQAQTKLVHQNHQMLAMKDCGENGRNNPRAVSSKSPIARSCRVGPSVRRVGAADFLQFRTESPQECDTPHAQIFHMAR